MFAWGKYGGFGRYVRVVGAELARRGFDVCCVIPRSANQTALEDLDGIKVFGLPYPTSLVDSVPSELLARAYAPFLYSKCRADIYHSVNPSFFTLLAKLANPTAKHIIAFSDLRDAKDWQTITSVPGLATLPNRIRALPFESPLMRTIVGQANATYATAEFLAQKAIMMYDMVGRPPILRYPYEPPRRSMKKSDQPTVCFLGRLDPIKRPWIFFELARDFPEIEFYVMGKTTVPSAYQRLIESYRRLDNLKFFGWAFGQRKSELLEKSWVLVNTSIHEALPTAFLEAWGHSCAILGVVNPDGLVQEYGHRVVEGNFEGGLKYLLAHDRWREKGRLGRHYVETQHDFRSNIEQLVNIYRFVLSQP